MSKIQPNSYIRQHQEQSQQNPIPNQNSPHQRSPFRKNLPIIFEAGISPHQKFATSQLYDQSDYMKQPQQSRLVSQQQFYNSKVSYDSQFLGQKERHFMTKIYEKEKELVLLEDKLFMLKNSNECLRDTIMEQKREKDMIMVELYQVKQRNEQLEGIITQLNGKVGQLQFRIESKAQQSKLLQQEQFFSLNNIKVQSRQQLVSENTSLLKQIQELKAKYEQEIYSITSRYQQRVDELQFCLSKTQSEIKETDMRYLKAREQTVEVGRNCERLCLQLEKASSEKKQMLQYYLQVIEEMKRQIQSLKTINNTLLQPMSMSENILVQHENSFQEVEGKQNDRGNNFSVNYHYNQQSSGLVDMGKMAKVQAQNQVLIELITKQMRDHSQEQQKDMKKHASIPSLHMNHSFQQATHNHSFQHNPNQPITNLPQSSLHITQPQQLPNQRLYNTTIPSTQQQVQRYRKRSTSRSKYRISPTRNISKHFSSWSSFAKLPVRVVTAQPKFDRCRQPMYREIDRKLDQIKSQVTKEIRY